MMEKFKVHRGIAAPIIRNNVDTDAIIPSREMKTVSKVGLADGLFAPWRYLRQTDDHQASQQAAVERIVNPDFVLNKPGYENASIIISGNNFGCGSSREHAVWALKEFGIRCIVAQSFGNIFFRNCVRNGILPIQLTHEKIVGLAEFAADSPTKNLLTIDLEQQSITTSKMPKIDFEVSDLDKNMLLNGLDQIALTQQLDKAIREFQSRDQKLRPWVY